MTSFNDQELLKEFLIESNEHLTAIEPDLLLLEKLGTQTSQEVINRIFRAIHSIKGSAGFLGFDTLKTLSHSMESVFMLLRDNKLELKPEIIDVMFVGIDRLKLMLNDIENSVQVDCDELLARLESLLNQETASESNQKTTTPLPDDSPPAVTVEPFNAAGRGVHFYQLPAKNYICSEWLALLEQVQSIGKVHRYDHEWKGESVHIREFCFSSVLEHDLIAEALGMPKVEINLLQPERVETIKSSPALPLKEPDPENQNIKKQLTPSPVANSETIETIRVRIDLLNKLMDLAGEMVLSRNQLIRTLGNHAAEIQGLSAILQNVDLVTSELQEHIMQTRMQQIGSLFAKFPRLVRDIARQQEKEIEIQLEGESVELDKSIIESLSDPLTHLIRNCCDHGIENAQERLNAGKNACGHIQLKAFHEGGQINILISDDGRGINTDKVAAKALEQGLIKESELRKMSEQEVMSLIFWPGFSTAEQVSDLSGRGGGMDVVKTNIERIGGHISIESEKGQGTSILLRLPLTLAIIPSLIVSVQDFRFAIPQLNLIELICVKGEDVNQRIERVGSADVLRLRGKLLPLVRLSDVLGMERTYTDALTGEEKHDQRQFISDRRQLDDAMGSGKNTETNQFIHRGPPRRQTVLQDLYIIILGFGANQYGLIVDSVLNLEEIVVKPLSAYLKQCQCFSAATIMGDGRVAMILDVAGIANSARLSFSDIHAQGRHTEAGKAQDDDLSRYDVILFNNALDEVFAVPLSSVLRLEKINLSDIQRIGKHEFIQYYGKGLPLVRLEGYLPVQRLPEALEEAYLIIPKYGNGSVAILVSRILDAMSIETRLQDIFGDMESCAVGAAIVQGQMTTFIEPEVLLRQAGIQSDKARVPKHLNVGRPL